MSEAAGNDRDKAAEIHSEFTGHVSGGNEEPEAAVKQKLFSYLLFLTKPGVRTGTETGTPLEGAGEVRRVGVSEQMRDFSNRFVRPS